METLENRLNSVRKDAIAAIKDFFVTNNLAEVNIAVLETGDCPMVTPEKSLDCIEYDAEKDKFYFDASGEYDNDTYRLEEVSTDCLVSVVENLVFYKDDILMFYNEGEE